MLLICYAFLITSIWRSFFGCNLPTPMYFIKFPEFFRPKEEMDFGVFQMDAVSDRKDINSSPLLVITHFGDHALHHLFPTIDHGKLKYLYPTFIKTCEEFGVEWRCTSQIETTRGQYLQLARDVNETQPKRMKKIES